MRSRSKTLTIIHSENEVEPLDLNSGSEDNCKPVQKKEVGPVKVTNASSKSTGKRKSDGGKNAKRPAKKSKKDDSEDEDEDDQDMGSDDEMTFDIRVKVKKSARTKKTTISTNAKDAKIIEKWQQEQRHKQKYDMRLQKVISMIQGKKLVYSRSCGGGPRTVLSDDGTGVDECTVKVEATKTSMHRRFA